jgi:hypothetical protein
LVPKQWNNLLDRKPTEFFYWNPANDARWDFDRDSQRVWVQTSHTTLLSLGSTDAPGYTLQVGLRQAKWSGGVGVFFGGKRMPDGVIRFHCIDLRGGPLPIENSFILNRAKGELQLILANEPSSTIRSTASQALPQSPDLTEQILEIRVSRRGLEGVRWNGIVCDRLQDQQVGIVGGDEYQGEFGLYVQGASAQLISARLMPSE